MVAKVQKDIWNLPIVSEENLSSDVSIMEQFKLKFSKIVRSELKSHQNYDANESDIFFEEANFLEENFLQIPCFSKSQLTNKFLELNIKIL